MPNYVKHILTINAEGQKLNQILDAIKGEDRVIDFNKIIPMPESLNVESGSRGDEAVKYIQSRMKGVKEQTVLDRENIKKFESKYKDDFREAIILGLTYIHNVRSYGCTTWYEWCCRYWGTKWNACDTELEDNVIRFETAWSSPAPVLRELSRKFPGVKFDVVFADEDCGYNTGSGYYLDGESYMYHPDGGSDAGYELYLLTHEWARDEMHKDENGHWKWNEED